MIASGKKSSVMDPFLASSPPPRTPASLIVVSNRLPFVLRRSEDGTLTRKASAGGLVTAVAPVVIDCEGLWVGWTGLHDFDPSQDHIPESSSEDTTPTAGLKSSQAIPVVVEPSLFDSYYNGCCNGTFWPLLHSMPDRAVFNKDHWMAYQKVNEIFAWKTMDAIRKVNERRMAEPPQTRSFPPIVWIHDYQLMLAANTIRDLCREEGIDIRMGFFLHIPFPSFDIIRIFPWVDEIVMGMLGCDLVAFHIEDYCLNFIDCCQRCLGCRTDKNKMFVEHTSRHIRVKALPIGIPYEKFESLSKAAPKILVADTKIILGVDRLDYTKGLVARLRAIERLFQKYPKWIGKVIFIQVAVPSRTDVKEYQELKETIDRLVGHINGEFTTPAWSPIRYIFDSVSQDQLVGFYRDADVALITPLRDGMNLVAKEFVASQDDFNPGVLVLSPFAGAGGLMQEALQVNPYEVDNVVDILERALNMSLDERKLRMNQLKKRERRMDVNAWVKGFLNGMDSLIEDADHIYLGLEDSMDLMGFGHPSFGIDFEATLGPYVEMCTKLGVILDFDGTLSHLARTPEMAFIAPETKRVLERLAKMSDVHVAIISGRHLDDLKHKVGVEGLTLAGSHGLKIQHPDGKIFTHEIPQDYLDRLNALEQDLRDNVEEKGAWVENKDLLVAWHYREIEKGEREHLINKAQGIYKKHGFETLSVSKRIENQPPMGFNRGDTCILILRSIFGLDWEERVQVIYAGDSAADEFAIRRLKGVAFTFRVTNEDSSAITKTNADYWLSGTDGVLKLLKFLERKLLGRSPKEMSRNSSVVSMSNDRDHDFAIDNGLTFRARAGSGGSSCGSPIVRRQSRSMYDCVESARTQSTGSQGGLHRKTLNKQMQNRLSRDESSSSNLMICSVSSSPQIEEPKA